jgi:large subunit ribosomal protein L31e
MGKKINHVSNVKKGEKELPTVTRTAIIHLHKLLHDVKFKKKAPRAVKAIKDYARKTMFTNDVRIDPELNQELWRNGIRNVDRRVEVLLERKKNEEDEEATEKVYTVVRLAK